MGAKCSLNEAYVRCRTFVASPDSVQVKVATCGPMPMNLSCMFIFLLICKGVGAMEVARQAHHRHMRGTDPGNPGDDDLTGTLLNRFLDEFPAKKGNTAPDPAACRPKHNATNNVSEARRTVVVAKYDEDVSWLKCLPDEVDVVVYQSKDSASPHFVENLGNEASKYLSYIIDHYDELPDTVMFMQAGRQDWHDPAPKDVLLQKWEWGTAKDRGGVVSLPTNAPCLVEDVNQLPLHDDVKNEPVVARALEDRECMDVEEHSPPQMDTVRKVWDDVFSEELGPLPQRWITHCCAQFEVSREAIQQHPAMFYQRLLSWTMENDKSLLSTDQGKQMRRNHDALRQDAGHVLEVTWALIFSNPMSRAVLPDVPNS